MSLAGPCEWCGGPQHWTIISGDVYVSCDLGCQPLPFGDLVPPPDSEELRQPPEVSDGRGTGSAGGGTGPPAGRESNTSVLKHIGVPLEAVLRNLFTGGPEDDHGEA